MSTWNSTVTNKGIALQNKMVEGATLEFTRVVSGTGVVAPVNLKQQTAVTGIKQTLTVTNVTVNDADSNYTARIMLNNIGLTVGYDLSQVGFYATDPDDGEVLFAIAQIETVKPIPTASNSPGYTIEFAFTFQNAQAATIDFDIDASAYLTRGTLDTILVDYYDKDEVDEMFTELNPNNLTGPVPIAKGGTGATTKDVAITNLLGQYKKNVSLTFPSNDYIRKVFPLFKITSGASSYCFAQGSLDFQRSNGATSANLKCIFSYSKVYNSLNCLGSYMLMSGLPIQIFAPCTFTYNNELYFGFDVFPNSAYFSNLQFDGYSTGDTSFMSLIPYYDVRDTGTVTNEEIYSSISYSSVTSNENIMVGNNSLGLSLPDNRTIYVNSTTGNDTTGDGTSTTPYATITKAISTLPKNLGGKIASIMIAEGSYDEDVNILNFGNGRISLTGVSGANVSIKSLRFTNVSLCYITNINLTTTGNYQGRGIALTASNLFSDTSSTITCTSATDVGLYLAYSSTIYISSLSLNRTTSSAALITTLSRAYTNTLVGTENTGVGVYCSGGSTFTYNARNMTAGTANFTSSGSRIYSGAQNSIPNY